ncbi:sensor histidine kinase [Arthrobacter sp. NPDC058192]|uniref:sensor histidine kinase n=1 Tax=Arthrobacter sp. NPDC058192 TaxID=3346372 RepID=UPI0036EE8246
MSRPSEADVGAKPEEFPGKAERFAVRAAVAKFLVMGFLALLIVATPVAFWIRAEAERHALDNALLFTQRVADIAIKPLMTQALLAGDGPALDALDKALESWRTDASVLRIKVWDSSGRVVYSDMRSLVGQRFELPDWGRDLLAGGPGTASLESQQELENEYELASGELVEVYVGSEATDGTPLIFEAYYDDNPVRDEQQSVLYSMIPPLLLALAALQLAQLPPAIRLARGIQNHQASRNRLLRRAVEASDLERRRIARDLHDEVIQDLSGLGYALESEELHGPPEQREVLGGARTILQQSVRSLRAMTQELYPPDLERLGLRRSLEQLVEPHQERGLMVQLLVPDDVPLGRGSSALLYRVAREALSNSAKHSGATAVVLSLRTDPHGSEICISDDGRGFDQSDGAAEGHLGLRILQDTIHEAGGELEILSIPGAGTTVRARLRARLAAPR